MKRQSFLKACVMMGSIGSLLCSGLYGQNVGIGTNLPQNRLHIDGATPADANSGQLRISESTNGRYMLLGRAADYGFIQTHNSQPLAINPLGNNVGIGTATPNARFHVLHPVGSNWLTNSIFDGGNNAPKLHIAIHSDGTHNGVPGYLTLAGSGGSMYWREYIRNWAAGYYWSVGSAAGEKILARLATLGGGNAGGTQIGSFSLFTATDAQTAGTNPLPAVGPEQVRLAASGNSWLVGGNVGIGTTNPTERLHVAGNLRLDNAFMPGNDAGTAGSLLRSAGAGNAPVWIAPGANGSVLTISGGLPTWSSPNGLFWGLTGNSGTNPTTNFLGTTDAVDLVIRTNNTERVRVTSGGNVGIGTTAPQNRLHVVNNATTGAPAGSSARFDNTAVGWVASQAIYARTAARFSTTIWSELDHPDGFTGAGFFYASPTPGAGNGTAVGVAGTTRQAGGAGVVGCIDYNNLVLSSYSGNSAVCGYNTGNTIYSPCVGVRGIAANVNDTRGVFGTSYGLQTSINKYAVFGEADAGANSTGSFWHVGVYGRNLYTGTNDWAVYANGRFGASGTKSFMIDHPLDPENKFLFHFSTEGPEPYNIYRGTVVTNEEGYAEIELPSYFSAANKEPSYYLTPIGNFAHAIVEKKIQENRFTIRTDKPNVEVCWVVISTRDDAYARHYYTPTEVEKSPEHRGKYINPLVYGKSIDDSITPPDNAPFIIYTRDGKREKYIRGKLVESVSIPITPHGDANDANR